jgi:xanthine/CO dehydrogenase XdhC/CoxF family maturation factor
MARHHRLLSAYPRLVEQWQDAVLATVIETEGSTYQKPGARMLIEADGRITGLLGGGCFEADLVEHARDVLLSGEAKSVYYDLRKPEDEAWGLGAGCHGATRIFLQLLEAKHAFDPLPSLAEGRENRESGILATVVDTEHPDFAPGECLLLPSAGRHPRWPIGAGELPLKPGLQTHWIGVHVVSMFYEPLRPVTRLLVLGAGDDAQPVVECAKLLGWKVWVSDHRPAYLHAERFPNADGLLHARSERLSGHLNLNTFDAALVMSHQLAHDRHYLEIGRAHV